MGMTHIRLAAANEDLMAGALRTAWRLRVEKERETSRSKRASAGRRSVTKKTSRKRRRDV